MEKEHYLHSSNHLEGNIANGWEFKFGDYISRGFSYTNLQIGQNLGHAFLVLVLLILTGLIPFVGSLVSSLFLSTCLLIGFSTGLNHYNRNQASDYNTFWDGFKFIGPITIYGLISIAISLVVVGVLVAVLGVSIISDFMEIQKNPSDRELANQIMSSVLSKGLILAPIFIIILFLTFPMYLAPFFIVFFGMEPLAGIKASYCLLKHNWVSGVIFIIVIGIIVSFGTLFTCGLGILYFLPVAYNMIYALFEDMTGLDREDNGPINHLNSDLLDG